MDEATLLLRKLLSSRRWVIGCRLGNGFDQLRRRRGSPLSSERIVRICDEFDLWKQTAPDSLTSIDVRRLDAWMRELDAAYHALLQSHRWRLGNAIVGVVHGAFFRSTRPASLSLLEQLFRQSRKHNDDLGRPPPVTNMSLADVYYHLGFVCERSRQWNRAASAYLEALKLGISSPFLFYRLGRVREHRRDWREAARLYETATRLDPTNPDFFYRLGHAREKILSESPLFDQHIGLHLRKQGDWPGAETAYLEAIRLQDRHAHFHYRLGHVREKMRDFEGATSSFSEAVRLAPDEPTWLYRLARARELRVDLDGALELYGLLLRRDPGHTAARARAYAIQIKLARWREASENALYTSEPYALTPRFPVRFSNQRRHRTTIKRLRDFLESDDLPAQEDLHEQLDNVRDSADSLPPDWWFALHWRCITLGWFSAAYQVKDFAASALIATVSSEEKPALKSLLDAAKAHVQLGQRDAAIQYLQSMDFTGRSPHPAVQKLIGDIRALDGDFSSLQQMMETNDGVNLPEAEDAFRSLIFDRNVAIVGPLANGLRSGAEIDSYDVVVRPNFLTAEPSYEQASEFGTRTDISYFNGVASRMLSREIREAVQRSSLRMIVLRPFNYRQDRPYIVRRGDLRYNPSESNAFLRARSFGIQRIAHDILRYKPRSVKIFNIDLFVSSLSYKKGYQASRLLTDLDPYYLGSGHDYRSDFEFTKRLRTHSLIEGDKFVIEILNRTTQEYLELLEGYTKPSIGSGSCAPGTAG